MSGAANATRERWTFGVRAIANQIPRATLRTTLAYRFHPRFSAGIEYNPLAQSVSPLANWVPVREETNRPAIMLGTSSDRIGTPHGQSVYLTLSKNLESQLHLPIGPYVGVAYGSYEDRVRPIGGLNITLPRNFSTTLIFDGVHLHPLLSYSYKQHVFSILLVRGVEPGVSYSISF